jgi:DNA (cytosine-5)-methyltransferase 1
MKHGDQHPEAHAIALRMFEERLREAGIEGTKQPQRPYDVGKFPNKWRKMWTRSTSPAGGS